MCNLHRRPAIDAFYQVSFHQTMRFQKRRFCLNHQFRNKNFLWQPCFLMDQDKIIEDLPQMLLTKCRFFWTSDFREYFQNPTNQKQKLPVAAMLINGSGRNMQSLQRIFHKCFIRSSRSFVQVVSEEKIFLNRPIRKNKLPVASMFVSGSGGNV